MRGAIKHIILLFVAAIVILFLAIPVLRRMEPHHDVAPPPVHDTTAVTRAPAEKPDSARVRDEAEEPREPVSTDEWRPVVGWEGMGQTITKRFTIIAPTWRLHWEIEVNPARGSRMYQIMMFDDRGAMRGIPAAGNKTAQGDTTLAGPGTFNLQIVTQQSWKVRIEERG